MGKALMILNEPAYGSERTYNGLRLAGALAKREEAQVRVFLIGDAVTCAKRGQRVPGGYYSLEAMLGMVLQNHGEAGGGRAGIGKGNFYAEPTPQVELRGPSLFWHAGKILYEKYWLYRRF